ncbi:MAG: hypothetical protein NTX50_18735 [Candidatus Sumerlaeota bacterium]|nr:hypothetical protein [Candidatus Sumerlaeota bacterium]
MAKWPMTLERARPCLEGFQPPAGAFDPRGAWEHRYAIWVAYPGFPIAPIPKSAAMGELKLRRKPAGQGGFTLEAAQTTMQGNRGSTRYRVLAKMDCAEDALATPRSWELNSSSANATGQVTEETQVSRTGKVAGGRMICKGKTERILPAPKAFTSNWSLFEAIQRLPATGAQPLEFDLLEEMDLLKPGQRLTFRETVEIELAGKPLRLHGFDQIGQGVPPYQYWLDDQRRLLLAVGWMRAYIYAPPIKAPEAGQ